EYLNWMNPPFISVNEYLNWMNPPFISVNEYLNWMNPPFISVNEYLILAGNFFVLSVIACNDAVVECV
ncbi:MAG: hypothetical protein V7K38_10540, partial [Nostoc sp.]|uniref:hypothetical protein n=1 Tax=Nostoc sp. TaxID=1180 RepID=UPI002FF8098C